MGALIAVAPYALFVVGVLAFRGGWLCRYRPERAGFWAHPAAALAVLTFMAAMIAPLSRWVARRSAAGGVYGAGGVILTVFFIALLALLYGRLLGYHAGVILSGMFSTVSEPPPDPEDPFERAKAAEDRGDVRGAIERYSWLLERRPAHAGARTRLAELLARTRRLGRASALLDEGIALLEAPEEARAHWRLLKEKWARGEIGEESGTGGAFRHAAFGDVTTARLEAHRMEERHEGGEPPAEV